MAEKVSRLLNQIENKELVLPEFQREFTWDRDRAKKLIGSFLKNYPTGALLFWETSKEIALKNMPEFDFSKRVKIMLDGQQRLSILYMLIKDKVPPYYKRKDIEKKDIRHLYYNLMTRDLEYYMKTKMENNPSWVKVTDCFKEDKVNSIKISKELSGENIDEDILNKVDENLKLIQKIEEKNYPILYVEDDSTLREALTVFDRINSQGVPLSEADISLAHMCSRWPNTRREFKGKIRELEEAGFSFDLTFFVRAMNAVVNHRAEYKQLHDNSERELKEGFKELSKILDYLINFLKDRAYVYRTDDLNTKNVLIPIIGYLSMYGPEFPDEETLKKVLYWMYAALYLRRYTNSVDQKLEKDLNGLKEENMSKTHPIDELLFILKEDEGSLEVSAADIASRGISHPFYNMMSIIIRSRGGLDWANNISLSKPYGKQYSIEKHHIFPKSILKNDGYDTNVLKYNRLVHEIANRVPLTKSSNLEIFNKRPSTYLQEIKKKNPGNLEKFFIPMNEKLWKLENYDTFVEKRRELIAEGINNFMESLLERKSKEEKSIKELIQEGENKRIEFKETLLYDTRQNQPNKRLKEEVAKEVCAFANSEGGTLIIGVRDKDNKVTGISRDLKLMKKGKDSFELTLNREISNKLDKDFASLHTDLKFEEIDGKEVCVVSVEKSLDPVYFGDEKILYVRLGSSSEPYDTQQANKYIKKHWS